MWETYKVLVALGYSLEQAKTNQGGKHYIRPNIASMAECCLNLVKQVQVV